MDNKENKEGGMSRWRGPADKANRNGRPKGIPNKNTNEVRKAYQNLVEMNLENMSTWIQQVAAESPEKAFDLMIKLSEFVLPKLQRTELTGQNGEDLFKDMRFEFGPSVEERLNEFIEVDTDDE